MHHSIRSYWVEEGKSERLHPRPECVAIPFRIFWLVFDHEPDPDSFQIEPKNDNAPERDLSLGNSGSKDVFPKVILRSFISSRIKTSSRGRSSLAVA